MAIYIVYYFKSIVMLFPIIDLGVIKGYIKIYIVLTFQSNAKLIDFYSHTHHSCRLETIAKAEKEKVLLEAEAVAESIRVKGDAKAFAILAKATAEAGQMAKKADAWKEYRQAAMLDMVLKTLPIIVAEIAAPLTETKKITMVTCGKCDTGVAKVTREVFDIVNKLPNVVESLTSVDISKTMRLKY